HGGPPWQGARRLPRRLRGLGIHLSRHQGRGRRAATIPVRGAALSRGRAAGARARARTGRQASPAPLRLAHPGDRRPAVARRRERVRGMGGAVHAIRHGEHHKTETSPYVGAALQMLAGGGAVALLGSALGEWSRWHLTAKGAGAIVYLVVFGSILGYSAYTYALRHASPTIVGTYAYVN